MKRETEVLCIRCCVLCVCMKIGLIGCKASSAAAAGFGDTAAKRKATCKMWAGAGTCRVAAAAGTAGRYCRPTSNFFADAQLQILNLNLPVDSLPLPAVSDDSAFPTSSFRQPLAKIDSSDFHLKRTGGVTAAAGGARRQRLPDQQLRHQVQ